MEEIRFSVFGHGTGSVADLPKVLQKFEQQQGVRVRLEVIPSWGVGWSRLVEMALYHDGPDVSEVGDTWVSDLVRMEALHLFTGEEVEEITRGERYFDVVWRSLRNERGVPTTYSIPLASDVRVAFYRCDLLEKAGVKTAIAFKDFVQFENALSCLKEQGVPIPLALPTKRSHVILHYLASWVWGAGGDFLSADGTRLTFDQPRAMEGCKAFFRLARFLGPGAGGLEEDEAGALFETGKAAILPSGFWVLSDNLADEVRANLGAAPMLGIPFVGGHHTVIWNHSRNVPAAIKLIQFLHTEEASRWLYPASGLPISEKGWANPPFDSELFQVFKVSIQKGRALPSVPLWGLVEKRLTDVLADIWTEVLKAPETRLDTIVETQLTNLARRLQLSLGSY
jgi:multiple sugar transport system substrate-binding protein